MLVPYVMGWPDQGLMLDVAVHVGTLGAVVLYVWRDVVSMIRGAISLLRGRFDAGARLLVLLIVATVPVVVAGLALKEVMPNGIRSIAVIGWTTLLFGILLGVVDRIAPHVKRIGDLRVSGAVVVGLSQCLALVPGTSRSGITMTAARALGYARPEAARFSMLLSIPAIAGAGLLQGLDLMKAGDAALTEDALLAAGLALVSALIAIICMMAWLRRATFTPFVVYRVILGVVLLAIAYGALA